MLIPTDRTIFTSPNKHTAFEGFSEIGVRKIRLSRAPRNRQASFTDNLCVCASEFTESWNLVTFWLILN